MRLAEFIEHKQDAVVEAWVAYATTLSPAPDMDHLALKDHIVEILQAVVADLRSTQTQGEQHTKSLGLSARSSTAETAAELHAVARAKDGFSIRQLVAEYRALRASVLALYARADASGPQVVTDIGRFNEAIDQAIAESVDSFTAETERWRDLLLGVLGHDLRGPLASVLMAARLIESMAANTPIAEPTQRLMKSGERLSALLSDLLEYSRSSVGQGIPVQLTESDVAASCREEVAQLSDAFPHAKISYDGPISLQARADCSRIRQVVNNLVTNAAKYGARNSPITVRLATHDDHVTLAVQNEGEPIPDHAQRVIFEPMHRGQHEQEHDRTSLGLGLYIVRAIAQAHGGEVQVESANRLNTFSVTWPLSVAV